MRKGAGMSEFSPHWRLCQELGGVQEIIDVVRW